MRIVLALFLLAGCQTAKSKSEIVPARSANARSSGLASVGTNAVWEARRRAVLQLDVGSIQDVSVQREILDVLMNDDSPPVRAVARHLVVNQDLIVERILSAEKNNPSQAKWLCDLLCSDLHRKSVIEKCLTADVAVLCAVAITDEKVMDAILHGDKGRIVRMVVGDNKGNSISTTRQGDRIMIRRDVEEIMQDRRLRIRMDEQIENCCAYARIFAGSNKIVPASFTFVGTKQSVIGGIACIFVKGVERQIQVEAPFAGGVEKGNDNCLWEVSGELEKLDQRLIRLRNPTWRFLSK